MTATPGRYGGECPSVYYRRLQRDGWALKQVEPWLATFEKRIDHSWIVRKFAFAEITNEQGHGACFDEHQLVHAVTGDVVDPPRWECRTRCRTRPRRVRARRRAVRDHAG